MVNIPKTNSHVLKALGSIKFDCHLNVTMNSVFIVLIYLRSKLLRLNYAKIDLEHYENGFQLPSQPSDICKKSC